MSVEEKIRRDYEAGSSYRQLAKKYRKSFSQIANALHPERAEGRRDVEGGLKDLEGRVGRLKGEVKEVSSSLGELRELKTWLERSLDRRFRRGEGEACIHLDEDGYCGDWVWSSPVKGWKMRREDGEYYLHAESHRWICALCPSFTSKSAEQRLIKPLEEAVKAMRGATLPSLMEGLSCRHCGSQNLWLKLTCGKCNRSQWWRPT